MVGDGGIRGMEVACKVMVDCIAARVESEAGVWVSGMAGTRPSWLHVLLVRSGMV